jgi:hypothetical protein
MAFCPRRPFGESLFEKSSAKTFDTRCWRCEWIRYDGSHWGSDKSPILLNRTFTQLKTPGFAVLFDLVSKNNVDCSRMAQSTIKQKMEEKIMKTRKAKGLTLKKSTVVNLDHLDMKDARGGINTMVHCPDTEYPCESCDTCSLGPSCQTIIVSCTPDWTNTCL